MIFRTTFLLAMLVSLTAHSSTETKAKFITKKQYDSQHKFNGNLGKKNKDTKRVLANTDRVDYASIFKADAKNISTELIGGNVWEESSNKMTSTKSDGIQNENDLHALVLKYDDPKVYNTIFNKFSESFN